MGTMRGLTMFLGSGVLLGLAMWGLDRLDYLPIAAWIGLGIVSALGLGRFTAIDRRRGSRGSIDHSTIYRLERGGQQSTLTTIQKLAALGVEPGELVIRD